MNTFSPTVYTSRFLKADRRTVAETTGSRTHRATFEQQACFDDVFLQPGASLEVGAAGWAGPVLVLPIVGGALLTTAQATEQALLPGCIYVIPTPEAHSFTLANPFEHETVNVLLLRVALPAAASATAREVALPLTTKNALVAAESPDLPARVGLYDSRVKDRIAVAGTGGYALCYVLNGSFEIEDRLVQHRDALLLWNTPTIEFEALTETAILFYLEFERQPA